MMQKVLLKVTMIQKVQQKAMMTMNQKVQQKAMMTMNQKVVLLKLKTLIQSMMYQLKTFQMKI